MSGKLALQQMKSAGINFESKPSPDAPKDPKPTRGRQPLNREKAPVRFFNALVSHFCLIKCNKNNKNSYLSRWTHLHNLSTIQETDHSVGRYSYFGVFSDAWLPRS